MSIVSNFDYGIDKPKQQRNVMEENFDWFSKWVWGETAQEGK